MKTNQRLKDCHVLNPAYLEQIFHKTVNQKELQEYLVLSMPKSLPKDMIATDLVKTWQPLCKSEQLS